MKAAILYEANQPLQVVDVEQGARARARRASA